MTQEAPRVAAGTPEFRRVNIGVFSCGFSIFAILYCTQSVLPEIAREFAVPPAQAALALSLTTITMAVSMLAASSISEVFGRKPLMFGALLGSALLTLALAFAPNFTSVLWLRALAGVTLSGMPAISLAFLGEEVEKAAVPRAVGISIGGGALGGMCGRLIPSFMAELGSWRWGMLALGAVALGSTLVFWRAMPPSRHFSPRPFKLGALAASMARLSIHPPMTLLILTGFMLLGGFMVVFNYLGFRLQAPPFSLNQALAGLIFLVYPLGSYASATMGGFAGRRGRGRALCLSVALMLAGVIVMTPDNPLIVALGLAILTFGFFGAHAVCSGWAPALTDRDKAQASSLYLLLYYIGGGVAGSVGGVFWSNYGWTGVAMFAGSLMIATFCMALALWRVSPTQ